MRTGVRAVGFGADRRKLGVRRLQACVFEQGHGGRRRHRPTWQYGGFWIRVVARLIDTVILYVAQIPIQLLFIGRVLFPGTRPPAESATALISATLWVTLANWALRGGYEVLMLRYLGATVGKMAVGL